MKRFTTIFLDHLHKKYDKKRRGKLMRDLMGNRGYSYHDAVVILAKWEKLEPEYIEEISIPGKYSSYISEINEIKSMLAEIPKENVIERKSLEDRAEFVREALVDDLIKNVDVLTEGTLDE
jgi:hypothetical protein